VEAHLPPPDLSETGRALGFNNARLGFPIPEWADEYILEGYRAGKAQHPQPPRLQYPEYERKLQQLRLNAYRRGRVVDEGVTVAFLQYIDQPICPVSYVTLTRATLTDSDWSIDRANNHGAYSPGNLVVLSTRVNTCKGALSLDEVWERASASDEIEDGLSGREWSRLASLMYGPTALETGDYFAIPQTAQLPGNLLRVSFQELQDLIALCCKSRDLRRKVVKMMRDAVTPGLAARFELLLENANRLAKAQAHTHDIWFNDELFDAVKGWLSLVGEDETRMQRMFGVTRSLYEARFPDAEDIAGFRFDSKGYR